MANIFRILIAGAAISIVFAGGAILIAGTVLLQSNPMLVSARPPDAEDVAATRTLVQNIRRATEDSDELLLTNATQLNSALLLGSRFIPGFRGQITVKNTGVIGRFSIPVRWWRGQRWLNIIGRAPEFSGQFSASEVFIGNLSMHPDLAVNLLRIGTNIWFGNRIGDTILQSATAMTIDAPALTFRLALDDMGKNGVLRGTFGALKGNNTLPTAIEIEAYHVLIRQAMDDKRLSSSGSFLPYLLFTLKAALNEATPETLKDRYTAAILGLAKACGAADFSLIVGRLVFEQDAESRNWTVDCKDVTFNGRIDSRRHFLTSAALQAISNTGFAVSAGEFKELYDTISGAGGFDFTDMAANLSGIRMSNMLMSRPIQDWPILLARLQSEQDVVPSFKGIPTLMSKEVFKMQFGDIDSAPYRQMISKIEARIDRLPLYRP